MNSVKLYSNGTAVISREYMFHEQQPLRISIPVRKTDLDDVISSLSVFGNVTISSPPTYTPTNAQETVLSLNPIGVLKELVTKLAGAAVVIDAGTIYEGKLVGMHTYRREAAGSVLEHCSLIVLTDKGMQQIGETSVAAIRFTDATIQAEIDLALRMSLSRIKPDSSVVELTLQPNSGATRALVTYATPVAAWKIRYQLLLSATEMELEGQAIVDNDTDDAWTETLITVITGEPITFSTDLAEIRRPARSRVQIVPDRATGAVAAESLLEQVLGASMGGEDKSMSAHKLSRVRSPRVHITYDAEAATQVNYDKAAQTQAEVREGGDFCVFTSPVPVTVGAKRSAIIPLFRTAFGGAERLLFFKERDDPRRPFRAVRITNPTTHSLGRGVCEIFLDGDFQGKCVLEPTKPGEEILLIHAKETGVRIVVESPRAESRRMAIRISDGTVYCEELNRQETIYRVQNSHAETFPLEIEHFRRWHDSKFDISTSVGVHAAADIPSGKRIRVNLESTGSLRVKVQEDQIVGQSFSLDASWLCSQVIELKAPQSRNDGIQKCIDLQKHLDSLKADVNEKEQAASSLAEEQHRLMELIPNGHSDQSNLWRTELANTEKELRELKRSVIPALKREVRDTQTELQEALALLEFSWSDQASS